MDLDFEDRYRILKQCELQVTVDCPKDAVDCVSRLSHFSFSSLSWSAMCSEGMRVRRKRGEQQECFAPVRRMF